MLCFSIEQHISHSFVYLENICWFYPSPNCFICFLHLSNLLIMDFTCVHWNVSNHNIHVTKGKWYYQLHKCQTQMPRIFSFNLNICNAKFVVNWTKSCLGSLSLCWLKFSFAESAADSFNFIGQEPWRPLWLVWQKCNHPTFWFEIVKFLATVFDIYVIGNIISL